MGKLYSTCTDITGLIYNTDPAKNNKYQETSRPTKTYSDLQHNKDSKLDKVMKKYGIHVMNNYLLVSVPGPFY